jgi:hypothetical protein
LDSWTLAKRTVPDQLRAPWIFLQLAFIGRGEARWPPTCILGGKATIPIWGQKNAIGIAQYSYRSIDMAVAFRSAACTIAAAMMLIENRRQMDRYGFIESGAMLC